MLWRICLLDRVRNFLSDHTYATRVEKNTYSQSMDLWYYSRQEFGHHFLFIYFPNAMLLLLFAEDVNTYAKIIDDDDKYRRRSLHYFVLM